MEKVTVLMSVYKNDKPEDFRTAVESITIKQTLQPDEVILIIDGPIPDMLKSTIESLQIQIPVLKLHWLEENVGLGNALRIGMTLCTHDLVARMDADDIAVEDRLEKQVRFMDIHKDIAVVGGQISEFIDVPSNIVAYRRVPLTKEGCRRYFRDRDPLNHMTVMFRKEVVLAVGNYQPWHLDEDTFLWGRIFEKGYEVSNLSEVLVNVRVGKQMYARRGGWKYFKSDVGILRWKLDHGLTGYGRYLYNYTIRFVVQVLMPNNVRGWFFKKMLRN